MNKNWYKNNKTVNNSSINQK